MRFLILTAILTCGFLSAAAQQKTELGLQVGVANYFGDFSPKNMVSSQTQTAYGAYLKFHFRPQWQLRFNFLKSKISGSDDNFSAGTKERRRGFSFQNEISQLAAIVEWHPLSGYRKISRISPFFALGHGLAFHNPQLFYNLEGSLINEDMKDYLNRDLRANATKPAPIFHLGAGARIEVAPKLSLGFEVALQPTLSDYLDGASMLGNPNKNDWHAFAVLQVAYIFENKMQDSDGDGVPDATDGCPDEPGKKKNGGCPMSKFGTTHPQTTFKTQVDSDGDGIPEPFDRCPNEAGHVVFNGCPDTDGDGLIDMIDKCPDFAGISALEGCPEDTFGSDDSFLLTQDESVIRMILEHAAEGIKFVSGAAELSEEAEPYLENVVSVLVNYPQINLLIEGHTDNTGDEKSNLILSENRAKKCLQYLVNQGIAAERITVQGFGSSRPITDNATADGKRMNRRVVFVVR